MYFFNKEQAERSNIGHVVKQQNNHRLQPFNNSAFYDQIILI